jgi:hypothetical protein
MTALPAATDFTGAAVTEGGFKTAITSLRGFLNGLLGSDGVPATALTALGAAALAANTFTGIQRWKQGSDVASANALTLGTDGNAFDITGTTAITSIGTLGVGTWVLLQFDGVLAFTHDAADLILPGGATITTAAGDIAVLYEYATGDWRCVSYTRADGTPVTSSGGTKEFFHPWTFTNSTLNTTWAGISIGSAATGNQVFFIPNDFASLTSAVILVIPDANETIQWDLATRFGAAGEAENAHTDSVANAQLAVTNLQLAELDITDALTGIAANDYCGLQFTSDTDTIHIIGLRIKYL